MLSTSSSAYQIAYGTATGWDFATGIGSVNANNLVSNWPVAGRAVVPGAPTGVSAVAGNAQATISFISPASNGGSPITSYTVTSNPGNITASGVSSPVTVTGLTNGTAYTFTITAINSVGTGLTSVSSNSVTPTPAVPGAPTAVSAVAGNAQATISFTAPASDGGSAILYYAATSSPDAITASASTSPIVVTGLTNGTSYTFTVTATNSVGTGQASAPSNSVTPNNTYSLSVTVTGNGTVHSSPVPDINCTGGTCTQSYPLGTVVALTPTPDTENIFAGWSNCDAPSCPSCNMTMDADKSIAANFWDECQLFLHEMGYQP